MMEGTKPERSPWMIYPSTTESVPNSALYRSEEIGLGRAMRDWASQLDDTQRAELVNKATQRMHHLVQTEAPLEDHGDARDPYWLIEVLRSTRMLTMTDPELSDYLTVRDTYIAWRQEQCSAAHAAWKHSLWKRIMKTEPAKEYNP